MIQDIFQQPNYGYGKNFGVQEHKLTDGLL